jgi:hypothetical protein
MKCLFFLYGEKRTFETARKFWNILDIPNLDILIHTPNTTSDYLGSRNFENVSEKDFNTLKNVKVFLHDRNDYLKTDIHVIHFSFRFLSEYLKDNVYDYVFIGRLDSSLYIENWKDVLRNKEDYLFTLQQASGKTFMQDHSFFGSYNSIKKFVDNLPNKEYWSSNDPHYKMCRYIENNFTEKLLKNYESIHIRFNMIRYFESYFNKFGKLNVIDKNYSNFIKEFKSKYEYNLDIEYKKTYRVDWIKDYNFKNGELENMYSSFLKNLNQ